MLNRTATKKTRNSRTAIALFAIVAGMGSFAYASEPLYRLFCQVTGFGGTTQIADKTLPATGVVDRVVSVRFDANVNHKLPWRFEPVQKEIRVKVGEQTLAFYEATNISDKPLVGTATFNVTPYKAATHFSKIDCFCFTEQVLRPGQTVQMPVSFFIDPEIVKDKDADDLATITLSYTFFQDQDQSAAEELAAQTTSLGGETGDNAEPLSTQTTDLNG